MFCLGTCFHRNQAVAGLQIVVGGVPYRPAAFAMPRRGAPEARRSGFWGTVPIPAHDRSGAVELGLRARLASGTVLDAPLGRIEVVEPAPPPTTEARPARQGTGLIAICMATYEPDMKLFRRQVESLRAQTDERWVCLISDDGSAPARVEQIVEVLGGDARFALSQSPQRLGFYRNFERALKMVPAEAELVALCDQDDRWHPNKLEVLRASLGDAQLVYSDQRLVDVDGRVLRETLWKGRRNNHTNLASLLIANSITGAASLFRREVAEVMLPFPDPPGFQFHDQWLGLVGLAMGEVAYVDRPLYDYVQHPGAVFGDVTHGKGAGPSTGWRGLPDRGRAAYFYGYLSREAQAQALLVRCADRLSDPKRRALRRFLRSASSPAAFTWLLARPLRRLAGRTETVGTEIELAQGIAWRWLAGVGARLSRIPRMPVPDASFPPPTSFSEKRLRRWRACV